MFLAFIMSPLNRPELSFDLLSGSLHNSDEDKRETGSQVCASDCTEDIVTALRKKKTKRVCIPTR